ncbi:unnamed protein product, partial [Ectocarpus sp. 12 AP-2014]
MHFVFFRCSRFGLQFTLFGPFGIFLSCQPGSHRRKIKTVLVFVARLKITRQNESLEGSRFLCCLNPVFRGKWRKCASPEKRDATASGKGSRFSLYTHENQVIRHPPLPPASPS